MSGPTYLVAPAGWHHNRPNPFTADGAYGPQWSCFEIADGPEGQIFSGRGQNGLYVASVWRGLETLRERLADFVRYESAYGRTVIVAGRRGTDVQALVACALAETPRGPVVRRRDPKWVLHSTTLEAWEEIRACGELRAHAAFAREEESEALGRTLLGEPEDYSGYVMFGGIDGPWAEYVVASHQRGAMVADENAPYEPGVRLYLDCHRIIRDGLGVRDGLHPIKVRDRLPLDLYLVAAVGLAEVDPTEATSVWTPKLFADRANAHFHAIVAKR